MNDKKRDDPEASVGLPEGAPTRAQFEFRVYPKELRYVKKRRQAHGLPFDRGGVDKPTTWHRLVGVAFSGGGIRSATFNLGIVQALHRWGFLKHVDVMSTVSGGGFIGSCITSLMSGGRKEAGSEAAVGAGPEGEGEGPLPAADFPLAPNPFGGERPALVHLRNNSNYLAPRGLLDYIWMFAVLVRGIILDFLVLVPFLLIPCLFATWFYGKQLLQRLEYDETVAKTLGLVVTTLATQADEDLAKLATDPSKAQDEIEVGNTPIAPLLDLLEERGFFPLNVLRSEGDVTRALRNPNPPGRDVKQALVTGSDTQVTKPMFLRDVKLVEVVKRLIDAGLVATPNTIRELWAVEGFLEERRTLLAKKSQKLGRLRAPPVSNGLAGGSAEPENSWEKLNVKQMLENFSEHLRKPRSETAQLFMVFVTEDSLREALKDEELIECEEGFPCRFDTREAAKPHLMRALQAFYAQHLFDPEKLEDEVTSPELGYQWPAPNDDADLQRSEKIERAARQLWLVIDYDSPEAVELFQRASTRGTPVIREEMRRELLYALETSGLTDDETAECQDGCFVKAKLQSLPEFLYDQGFYSEQWLTIVGAERPEQATDQNSKEIEAARLELDLRSSTSVSQVMAELSEAANAADGDVALVDSRRWWDAERMMSENPAIDLPASLRTLLEKKGVIRCKTVELETCEWTRTGSAKAVPRLLYEFEFYNRGWFVAYFTEPDRTKLLTALKKPKRSQESDSEDKVAYRRGWDEAWREKKNEIESGEAWNTKEYTFKDPSPAELFGALEKADRRSSQEKRQAVEGAGGPVSAEERANLAVIAYKTELNRAFERLQETGHLGPAGCEWVLNKAAAPVKAKSVLRRMGRQAPPESKSLRARIKKTQEKAPCAYRTSFDRTIQELFDMGLLGGSELYSPPVISPPGWFSQRVKWAALGVRSYFVDVSWNPYNLHLPLTQRVAILALGWVLVFPFVSLFVGARAGGGLGKHDFFEKSFGWVLVAIAGVAFFEVQPYLIFRWHYLDLSADWSMAIGAVSVISAIVAGPALSFFKKFGRTIVLTIVALLGPLLPIVIYLSLLDELIYNEKWQPLSWFGVSLPAIRNGYELDTGWMVAFFLLAGAAVHLFLLALNPNSTGMHGFYKSRLGRAYLLGETARGEIEGSKDLALSRICPDSSGAPYHLLNVALNLQASDDPDVRDRNSDFFMFSRLFVGGGKNTGYCRTRQVEKLVPELSLGTAMAVSGAAAAPNMGGFTVGPLVILMALLNIRLGYWLPNPRHVRTWSKKTVRGFRSWLKYLPARLAGLYRLRPGPYLFLRELLSLIHDKGRCVNVSDGGHLENTAIFELLRRRCSLIIAGDAEADAATNFGGLAALQRLARIDLSTDIRMNTAELRPENGKSARHFAVGEISYPETAWAPKETGYLIYLKSAMTGDESQVVLEYSGRRPLFPNEPTSDQFFDESQFEAYRDLGAHTVNALFRELGSPDRAHVGEDGWLQGAVLKWVEARAEALAGEE